MRHIFRIFILASFALFLTSYWNAGFILSNSALNFVYGAIALTVLYIIIQPLMKVIFLPFNILTFGLFSFLVYVFLLHLISTSFGLFTVKTWHFPGLSIAFIIIPRLSITYFQNLVLSSFSLSSIINVLDQLT